MDIEIKKLQINEIAQFVELIRLFEDVFEIKNFSIPGKKHLQDLLSKPDFFVFIAIKDNDVIGGLTAYTLHQYYSEKPLSYIYDLAVSTKHQRQGVGKKLIVAMNEYCKENGFEEVFVQADKVDEYAIDFYRSTKPTNEEDVIHFYYSLG